MTGPTVDLAEAVRLLESGAVAIPIERDLLVVSGADAASYLQGQLSQDVEAMEVGATTRSLLLQPQGKIDAWLRVHRRAPDRFWLDVDPGFGQAAQDRLNRFKLRVDATIAVATVTALAVRGVGTPEMMAAAAGRLPESTAALDAGWGGTLGCDIVGPDWSDPPTGLAVVLDLPIGPPEALELVRVRQGLPAMGAELDGSTIPAAAGIVDRSVSFTKGCYVGQELVARIDSRGSNTPTRLHSLRISGSTVPAPGSDLWLDGDVVGRVTSAVATPTGEVVGLGYLKRSVEAPAELSLRAEPSEEAPAWQERRTVQALPLPAATAS